MENISYVIMKEEQCKEVQEPNPILQSSKSTQLGQSHPAMLKWRTSEKTGRQHPAYNCQQPGGTRHCIKRYWMKTQNLDNMSVSGFYRFHQPVKSMLITCLATISFGLVSSGCINSTHCQWWSRLFWISQLVWERVGSYFGGQYYVN